MRWKKQVKLLGVPLSYELSDNTKEDTEEKRKYM